MSCTDMIEAVERQQDSDAGQADMLQALRSAALPDDFWMYSYKILPCPHGYRHSWTHCPFSHVGETARRRCPRTHSYLPDPCVNARAKRQCPNGDACPYAHNTFEQWLHPSRYRTRLCYLGANCRRPTCFFAHSVEELRSVDENDSGGAPVMTQPLPPLPVPPPLPSPASSGVMAGSGSGSCGDLGLSPTMQLAGGASGGGAPHLPAVPGGPPMGLLQPVVLMGIPQPMPQQQQQQQQHQALRSDIMAPHGAVQCYVPYQPRPAMLRSPMPLQNDSGSTQQMHLPMHPSGAAQMAAVPVAVRSQAPAVRPQHLAPQHPTTVAVAAVHRGPFVVLHSHLNVPPSMPAGMTVHGPPPPPPPPPMPLAQGYSSPFVTPGGFHRGSGGEGVPPSLCPPPPGRVRSWSNPGETAYFVSAAPAPPPALGGGGSRTFGGDVHPPAPMWPSADAGRRTAAPPPPAVAPMAPPSMRSTGGHGGGGGGRGASNSVSSGAPRHMPAPTNRGGALRRISSPADSPPPMAAAVAAAAVTALHYPDQAGSGVSSPGLQARGSAPTGSQQQQISSGPNSIEAALRALELSEHVEASSAVAAPPPTPSHLGGSYSPSHSASSASSPQSMSATVGSPGKLTMMRALPSADDGSASSGALSSAGSDRSAAGTVMSGYDSSTAAAALAAVSAGVEEPTDAVAGLVMPYNTLLQHVLRSASSSAAEPPAGLLPALFTNSDSGHAVHADLYYDDDVADVAERSSDPGPGGLRATARRMSIEFGAGAACRNSDPGHSVPTAGCPHHVQQLLLPLLQSVLTEGLATGQFELVNGQLQMKGGGRALKSAAVGPLSVEPAPACVASSGVNA